MNIVVVNSKPMRLIFRSFEVGQIEGDRIAFIDRNMFRVDVRSNHRTIDIDMVTFSNDLLLSSESLTFVYLSGESIRSHFIAYMGMQFVCSDCYSLVRFTQRYRHIVE